VHRAEEGEKSEVRGEQHPLDVVQERGALEEHDELERDRVAEQRLADHPTLERDQEGDERVGQRVEDRARAPRRLEARVGGDEHERAELGVGLELGAERAEALLAARVVIEARRACGERACYPRDQQGGEAEHRQERGGAPRRRAKPARSEEGRGGEDHDGDARHRDRATQRARAGHQRPGPAAEAERAGPPSPGSGAATGEDAAWDSSSL